MNKYEKVGRRALFLQDGKIKHYSIMYNGGPSYKLVFKETEEQKMINREYIEELLETLDDKEIDNNIVGILETCLDLFEENEKLKLLDERYYKSTENLYNRDK